MAAVIVCYACICGGNISGFTSSAIPSMRQSSHRIERICNNDLTGQKNVTPTDIKVGIGIAALSFNFAANASNSENDGIAKATGVKCEVVKMENMDVFLNITDAQASWIGKYALINENTSFKEVNCSSKPDVP